MVRKTDSESGELMLRRKRCIPSQRRISERHCRSTSGLTNDWIGAHRTALIRILISATYIRTGVGAPASCYIYTCWTLEDSIHGGLGIDQGIAMTSGDWLTHYNALHSRRLKSSACMARRSDEEHESDLSLSRYFVNHLVQEKPRLYPKIQSLVTGIGCTSDTHSTSERPHE